MFFKNHMFFSKYSGLNIDFNKHLTRKDSLIFKNCKDINIKINSKVNKLVFYNCQNVTLKCSETISGIEIEKCLNFNLLPMEPYNIKFIDCYKSYINCYFDKDFYIYCKKNNDKLKILNQYSKINIIK